MITAISITVALLFIVGLLIFCMQLPSLRAKYYFGDSLDYLVGHSKLFDSLYLNGRIGKVSYQNGYYSLSFSCQDRELVFEFDRSNPRVVAISGPVQYEIPIFDISALDNAINWYAKKHLVVGADIQGLLEGLKNNDR